MREEVSAMATVQLGAMTAPRSRKKKPTPEQLYESLDEDVKAKLIDGEVVIIPDVRAALRTMGLR